MAQEQGGYKAALGCNTARVGEEVQENMAMRWLPIVFMLALLARCVLPACAEDAKRQEEQGAVHAKEMGVSMTRLHLRLTQKLPSIGSQDRWYWITPPNEGKRLDALAHGGNTFVALLNPGGTKVITPGRSTTFTSHDGRDWSAGEINADGVYSHLTYGNGLFVAVGRGAFGAQGGTIVTSGDGMHWTERVTTTHELTHVFYGNEMFIALGLRGTIVTSAHGVDWSESMTEPYGHLYAGAYGNNTFVLVGDVSIVTSPDAFHWTRHTNQDLGVPFGLRHITFGNNHFLLWSDQALFTSADGTQWLRKIIDLHLREIVYIQKTFFASSDDGTVFTSADGTQWIQGPKMMENVEGVSCHTHRCIVLGKHILVIGSE